MIVYLRDISRRKDSRSEWHLACRVWLSLYWSSFLWYQKTGILGLDCFLKSPWERWALFGCVAPHVGSGSDREIPVLRLCYKTTLLEVMCIRRFDLTLEVYRPLQDHKVPALVRRILLRNAPFDASCMVQYISGCFLNWDFEAILYPF